MEQIKKILFEIDYISSIYNDVKKTYNDLDDKQIIYQAYNNNDLKLLYVIVRLSNYIMHFILNIGDKEISSTYFNHAINTQYDKYNSINIYDINFEYYTDLFDYHHEKDLFYCKSTIIEYLNMIENNNQK